MYCNRTYRDDCITTVRSLSNLEIKAIFISTLNGTDASKLCYEIGSLTIYINIYCFVTLYNEMSCQQFANKIIVKEEEWEERT